MQTDVGYFPHFDHLPTGRVMFHNHHSVQQVADLTKERHPEFDELVRWNGNRDDDSSVCQAALRDAIQTVPEALGGIAALVTDAVGVMLLAVGVVAALGTFLLAVPAVIQTLTTDTRLITDAVVEQQVARDIKLHRRAVLVQRRVVAAVCAVKITLERVTLLLQRQSTTHEYSLLSVTLLLQTTTQRQSTVFQETT